ncbi:MAG: tetratricopeptide repeat protein [Bacteroidales bacterium]
MNRFFFTLVLMCSIKIVFSQSNDKPINYRFKGGEKSLIEFLGQHIKYPSSSLEKNSMGYSISGITITPKGTIDSIIIINSIDDSIDYEIYRVLSETKDFWMRSDSVKENQTFYMQNVFISASIEQGISIDNPIKNNIFFIEPITITALSIGKQVLTVTNEKLIEDFAKTYSSEKFDEAIGVLSELIKRDPYNINLYQYRILIYKETGNVELMNKDLHKLSEFIPNMSLEELIKN